LYWSSNFYCAINFSTGCPCGDGFLDTNRVRAFRRVIY
jgi:hypothetical protein